MTEAKVGSGRCRCFLSQALLDTTTFFLQVIPSVVIEPASNHEEEGDHEIGEIKEATKDVDPVVSTGETQELATDQKPLEDLHAVPPAPAGAVDQFASAGEATQDVPPGFLYKVFFTITP
jgi:amphiphysin